MTDFLLNECGDLDYTDGKLTIVTGVDAIRQRWLIYIRTFLAEWFLDQSIGVPYFQQILKKAISRQVIKQVFSAASLEVPGVIQVVSVIVDQLDVATRFAEVTVTCIVTGDEGPETGVFEFTGTIPPDLCGQLTAVPETIDDQWYWFDPSDLDFVADPATGGSYVAGEPFVLLNKFEAQQGAILVQAEPLSGAADPRILPVVNGRKGVDGQTAAAPQLVCGYGVAGAGAQVRALRTSTGHNVNSGFTVFGVYQPLTDPGAGFEPIMCLNGVDIDGITQVLVNIRFGSTGGDLRFQVETATPPASSADISDAAAGVSPTDTWAFCARIRESEGTSFDMWVNGVNIDTVFVGGQPPEQTGELGWNATIAPGTGVYPEALTRAHFGEMLGYSAYITDDEVAAMFVHLLAKWGI